MRRRRSRLLLRVARALEAKRLASSVTTTRAIWCVDEHGTACGPCLLRGSNENTNGLIRQYLPKGVSMAHLTQADCDRIADKLNRRPRKRYNWRTPEELYAA